MKGKKRRTGSMVSIHQLARAEERSETIQLLVGDTVTFHISDASERVGQLKQGLSSIEFRVLFLCFGCGRSESEVAKKIGRLNRNQVHGIKRRAVKKAKARVAKP